MQVCGRRWFWLVVSVAALAASSGDAQACEESSCQAPEESVQAEDGATDVLRVERVPPSEETASHGDDAAVDAEASPARLLILDLGDLTGPLLGSRQPGPLVGIERPSTRKGPLWLGSIKNDVVAINAVSTDAGTLQFIGVGPASKVKLGIRWSAPSVAAGKSLRFVPWLRATYRYDVLGESLLAPLTLTETLDLGGGFNVFSGSTVAASLGGDWERHAGATAVSGLGRVRIGF